MARAVIKTEGSPDQKPKTKSSPSKKVPSHRVSPFPSYDDPTPEMCEQVNSLLESVHYKVERPLGEFFS